MQNWLNEQMKLNENEETRYHSTDHTWKVIPNHLFIDASNN